MVRKIFTLLVLGMCIFVCKPVYAEAADVAINEISFPDEYLREYVREKIDKNADGILQEEEAAEVTEISLKKFKDADDMDADQEEDSNNPAASERHYYTEDEFTFDFKGIGYFKNLSSLIVNLVGGMTKGDKEYPVKISNIASLYKVSNLKKLTIYKADLTTFDCSHFPKLEKLELTRFNRLKKLIFKGNSKLKKVDLSSFDKLATLDVTSLGGLTNLSITASDIKSVKFGKKNKAIKSLQFDSYVNEYFTKIKSLDLRKLTGLKKLYISWMKNLKSLDLSQNKNLQLISMDWCSSITKLAPAKNKKLIEVSVWDCKKLGTLDLSTNSKLQRLSVQGMKVKTIRLSKKNKLNYFRYAQAKLTKFDVKNINTKTLKELQLFGNKLKSVNVKKYKKLETIDVDKGVKVIR